MKKIITLVMAAVSMAIISSNSPTIASATTGDCSTNSVVKCGVWSAQAIKDAYSGDVGSLFARYGITSDMIGQPGMREGTVTKSGNVILDGKVIANDARSVGREFKSGSTSFVVGSTTFYERPTSVIFASDSLAAYIFTDQHGAFIAAILKTCGNPVKATPTFKPALGVTIVKKVDAVDHKTVNLDQLFTYTLTVTNTGNVDLKNVVVTDTPETGITLVSADSGTITNNTWRTTIPSLAKSASSSFTIKAKVTSYVAEHLSNTACVDTPETATSPDACDEVTVDVPAPKNVSVCNPTTGAIITVKETEADKYKPSTDKACGDMRVCVISTKTEKSIKTKDFDTATMTDDLSKCDAPKVLTTVTTIANTGPTDIVMGTAGLGSLTVAGYYFRHSRRRFIDSFFQS